MSLPASSSASPTALFAAHPELAARLPHRALGRFPTRVERVTSLVAPTVDLWVKREDESGARYGGNKVRKLEFLLGEALARGKRRLVTIGGFGSHHVLATGIYGRAAGLEVDAVVVPQPMTEHVRDTVRCGVAAGLRYHPVAGFAAVAPQVLALRARRDAYFVPPGGSSPAGTLGFVSAGLELAAQVRAGECAEPDVAYAALGSLGTVAGLALGLRLGGLATRVVGVQVVDGLVCNRRRTVGLLRRTARLLAKQGLAVPDLDGDALRGLMHVETSQFGGTYGLATPAAERAVARAASVGLTLETTYTGKALAALLADADAGLLDGQRVLYLHTYSSADLTPLLDAPFDVTALPRRLAAIFPT